MRLPPSSVTWRFLIDESLPRPLSRSMASAGYDVEDGRDVGLRSQPDRVVFAYAQAHDRTIITLDKGLGSTQTYPTPHAGIVVVRLPDRLAVATKVGTIVTTLRSLAGQSFANTVVIIEIGRVRIHR